MRLPNDIRLESESTRLVAVWIEPHQAAAANDHNDVAAAHEWSSGDGVAHVPPPRFPKIVSLKKRYHAVDISNAHSMNSWLAGAERQRGGSNDPPFDFCRFNTSQ